MHSDTLVLQIKQALGLSELQLKTLTEWGSLQPGSRLQIRQDLSDCTGVNLLNLNSIPELATAGVSISHHRARGGFILSQDSRDLGFDMELNERVREDLLKRVLVNEPERATAPSAAALWTAKEAAFKCLKNLTKPRGLADVEIGRWKFLGQNAFSCEVISTNFKAIGVVLESPIEGETWAFFRGFRFEEEEGLQRCVGY